MVATKGINKPVTHLVIVKLQSSPVCNAHQQMKMIHPIYWSNLDARSHVNIFYVIFVGIMYPFQQCVFGSILPASQVPECPDGALQEDDSFEHQDEICELHKLLLLWSYTQFRR